MAQPSPSRGRRVAARALLSLLLAGSAFAAGRAAAQRSPATPPDPAAPSTVSAVPRTEALVTVFLRHDQTKTLPEIEAHLERTGFHARFPPPGVEVVSWYVMMGIGQVVTLKVPPDKLRELNLVIENGAWGAFRTDFYPTYDYRPMWEAQRRKGK